ncbi:serine/threonine-protein kinase [Nocardia pseudobrasiliensis]|uniref:Serine/threonine protein kinase n=1 Tax=Nocardia pseudobrasiliensis TaxID=45979 RepID=A0A370I2J2_9NOCA|nr:serine/threonine-protein kinase [Nocardia pseudobrasiliensis]RDI63514.1 serine/threonine protein kinase [Nocardia pseudobrasiliensis]
MRPLGHDDPTTLGDYRLLGILGAGGMGRVYLGRTRGGRTVAVKVVRPDLAGDPEFRIRFRREVDAARRVGGPHTVPVLDADPDAPTPWLATAFIVGPDLGHAVTTHGPLPEPALRALTVGLTRALLAIHTAGLVHRDLKPSNVLLAVDGPRVIDFGIARAADDSHLTTTGKVIGSPGYLCPERITGTAPLGPAGDVFALGAVLTYAATATGPFGDGDPVAMLWRVVAQPPHLDTAPAALRPLLRHCLAKDPADRPTPEEILTHAHTLGPIPTTGWLPAALTEDIGRRAVALLDLETATDPATPPTIPAGPHHRGTETRDRSGPQPQPAAPQHNPATGHTNSTPDHRTPRGPQSGPDSGSAPPPQQTGTQPHTSSRAEPTPPRHEPDGESSSPPPHTPAAATYRHEPGPHSTTTQHHTTDPSDARHDAQWWSTPPAAAQPGPPHWASGSHLYTDPADEPRSAPPAYARNPAAPAPAWGTGTPPSGINPAAPHQSPSGPHTLVRRYPPTDTASTRPHDTTPTPRRTPVRWAAAAAFAFVLAATTATLAYTTHRGAPATAPSDSGDTTAATTQTLPDAFVGTWSGQGSDNGVGFDITVTLHDGTLGDELGSSRNAGAHSGAVCERAETLASVHDSQITLHARLLTNGALCNDDGQTSTLSLNSDGSLDYSTPGLLGAITGTLHRQ